MIELRIINLDRKRGGGIVSLQGVVAVGYGGASEFSIRNAR